MARIVHPSLVQARNSLKPTVLRYSDGSTTAGTIHINLVYNQGKVDLSPEELLEYFVQNIAPTAKWRLCVSSSDFCEYKDSPDPSVPPGQMVVFDMFYTNDLIKDHCTVADDIGKHLRSVLEDASSTRIFLRNVQCVFPYKEF